MAVPASGQLTLIGIYDELSVDDYTDRNSAEDTNISLKECSEGDVSTINLGNLVANRPDGSAPHGMTEFFAYNNGLTVPSYSSVIANLTLQASAGAAAAVSSAVSFVLEDQITNVGLTAGIAGDTSAGTLDISMSASGDPGAGGTANSATGYVTEGSTCTLSSSDLGTSTDVTIHVRFRYTPAASAPENSH